MIYKIDQYVKIGFLSSHRWGNPIPNPIQFPNNFKFSTVLDNVQLSLSH